MTNLISKDVEREGMREKNGIMFYILVEMRKKNCCKKFIQDIYMTKKNIN